MRSVLSCAIAALVLMIGLAMGRTASAQNDWQYPDPYFGIIEFEKSHSPAAERRYRAEVSPPTPARPATVRSRQRLFRPSPRRVTKGSSP